MNDLCCISEDASATDTLLAIYKVQSFALLLLSLSLSPSLYALLSHSFRATILPCYPFQHSSGAPPTSHSYHAAPSTHP
jgi:hypothetical protein